MFNRPFYRRIMGTVTLITQGPVAVQAKELEPSGKVILKQPPIQRCPSKLLPMLCSITIDMVYGKELHMTVPATYTKASIGVEHQPFVVGVGEASSPAANHIIPLFTKLLKSFLLFTQTVRQKSSTESCLYVYVNKCREMTEYIDLGPSGFPAFSITFF